MLELVASPFTTIFDNFISNLETKCLICSPYISHEPVARLIRSVQQRKLADTLSMHVLTDLSTDNFLKGSSDIDALIRLSSELQNIIIGYAPKIHAKVYLANDDYAVVGSANFTGGGDRFNLEYGVLIRQREIVTQIRSDIAQYAKLGGSVSLEDLLEIRSRTVRLKEAVQEEQKAFNRKVRELTRELEREAKDKLIRIQVEGRTFHAILCDTILYLLGRRAMTTPELHNAIQEIHPDMCDDDVDRVIAGQHFGKRWKHDVRNAQLTLKRKGLIERREGQTQWSLMKV